MDRLLSEMSRGRARTQALHHCDNFVPGVVAYVCYFCHRRVVEPRVLGHDDGDGKEAGSMVDAEGERVGSNMDQHSDDGDVSIQGLLEVCENDENSRFPSHRGAWLRTAWIEWVQHEGPS